MRFDSVCVGHGAAALHVYDSRLSTHANADDKHEKTSHARAASRERARGSSHLCASLAPSLPPPLGIPGTRPCGLSFGEP